MMYFVGWVEIRISLAQPVTSHFQVVITSLLTRWHTHLLLLLLLLLLLPGLQFMQSSGPTDLAFSGKQCSNSAWAGQHWLCSMQR
jgi:hypothetical protein